MTSWVCVDSSIVLKLVLNEPDSEKAEALWLTWLESNQTPVAPPLFPFELTAVLRKHVARGSITEENGSLALDKALAFGVRLSTFDGLHKRAWEFATRLNRPTAYDAHYLALASEIGCDFWTADERLFNAARPQLPWVRWLGHFDNTTTNPDTAPV